MEAHVEALVKALNYFTVFCAFVAAIWVLQVPLPTDFEIYSAAQHKWLEGSSVSNFESFQSNRMKCRFKNTETGKTQLCPTLNDSSLALPEIVAALL